MNLMVTGGAGFIGSAYIRMARRQRPDDLIVNVDALTYAGNLENLRDLDTVVNFAAESHVDRSILSAEPFLDTNVTGTLRLLEAARAVGVRRFVQISTDEVYGTLGPTGAFAETTPVSPRSPYSASKAAADHFVMAFHHTHGMDALITRCSNNYGAYQFPEKLIPLMILNALEGVPLPVYGDGLYVRDWIHVDDHCAAVDAVIRNGRAGEVYNIGAGGERPNLEVVREILRLTGRDESLIRHVADRPGHDRRYAMNADKIRGELGWRPRRAFEEGLAETVAWYRANAAWTQGVRSGAYREYYERQYAARLSGGAPSP
jgi:dTDP-glucose 4,6-dehydratase